MRGFTLVEVMVALAVSALLVTGVWAATNAAVQAADRRKTGAREEERMSRTLELLRDDWRGRTRLMKPEPPAPAGTTMLLLSTTSDSISPAGGRSSKEIRYVASEKGLLRQEGGTQILLVERPARLEVWDGATWRADTTAANGALRVSFESLPPVVFR